MIGYVYKESPHKNSERAILLENNSEYFNTQQYSPTLVTIKGPCENPSWKIIKDGNILSSALFNITIKNTEKLIISSYPENQYARLYDINGNFKNVIQFSDFSQSTFMGIPLGTSVVLAYIQDSSYFDITFREERLVV